LTGCFSIGCFDRSDIFCLSFIRRGCFFVCLGVSLALLFFVVFRSSFLDVLLFGTDEVALDVIEPRVSLFRIFWRLFFLLLLFICFVVGLS
jgi:hypothetical protein